MSSESAVRTALHNLLLAHGYEAAAGALYVADPRASMTMSRALADTRDGRADAVGMLQEAFESGIGVIIIEEPRPPLTGARRQTRGGGVLPSTGATA